MIRRAPISTLFPYATVVGSVHVNVLRQDWRRGDIVNCHGRRGAGGVAAVVGDRQGHGVGAFVAAIEAGGADHPVGDGAVVARPVVHLGGGDARVAGAVQVHVNVLRQDCRRGDIVHRHGRRGAGAVAAAVGDRQGHDVGSFVGAIKAGRADQTVGDRAVVDRGVVPVGGCDAGMARAIEIHDNVLRVNCRRGDIAHRHGGRGAGAVAAAVGDRQGLVVGFIVGANKVGWSDNLLWHGSVVVRISSTMYGAAVC